MKFFIKSLPIACIALMLNCSKSSPGSPLVGTWTRIKTTYSSCTNPAYNSTTNYACPASSNNPLNCDQITFNSNGTVRIARSYVDSNIYYHIEESLGTYSVQGTQLTETFPGYTADIDFTISADKKTLITTYINNSGCTVTDFYGR